ncbi:DUF805 domain-containing protein, partial [Bacteroides thetaiotaomicron]|uniref:DUF805 domain-containing protein n=1 Tax=Bacteroides thetaiotaomicron TaxID=818 RepID=UPI001E2FB949
VKLYDIKRGETNGMMFDGSQEEPWFSLAQGVKRLHDLNKSGWLILICCVPIIGWVFSLYMLFADGTVGPNQYGEDPKNRMPYQPQPTSVNVTVNVSRETPAEAPAEEEKTEKAE